MNVKIFGIELEMTFLWDCLPKEKSFQVQSQKFSDYTDLLRKHVVKRGHCPPIQKLLSNIFFAKLF